MTSVQDTLNQINTVLKEEPNIGPYSSYSCKTVSWDDVQRGTVGGELSCWGANITDTRLHAKDGRQLFTVRGDNWNERLGKVKADDLALIASDVNGGGTGDDLKPVTLKTVLSNISKYGKYANLSVDSLLDEELDQEISVRFQTTFLPVDEGEKQTLEFAPEAYNYNTTSDDDPRNLVLLCTTQGMAIQQDGKGAKKLYHHVKDHGRVNRYWLEAESSSHKVGGSQVETKEEKEDALERGKATSSVIGTKAIGTRFNVLMTIQVPLKQKDVKPHAEYYQMATASSDCFGSVGSAPMFKSGSSDFFGSTGSAPMFKSGAIRRRLGGIPAPAKGKSSAARVSRGSFVDSWGGVSSKEQVRHPNEHVTATIVMYYTCSGGVPTAEDVKRAIDDLEELYQAVEVNGNLADEKFDFMKSELTVKDAMDIKKKVLTQPPPQAPVPGPVMNATVFPQ